MEQAIVIITHPITGKRYFQTTSENNCSDCAFDDKYCHDIFTDKCLNDDEIIFKEYKEPVQGQIKSEQKPYTLEQVHLVIHTMYNGDYDDIGVLQEYLDKVSDPEYPNYVRLQEKFK